MTTIYETALLAGLIISLVVLGLSWRNLSMPGARNLALLAVTVGVWSLAYLLFIWQWFTISGLVLIAVNYICSSFAAAALLVFALSYNMHGRWITRVAFVLLIVEPLLTQVLFWVRPWRAVFFLDDVLPPLLPLSPLSGLWSQVHTIYVYNLEIASVLLLTDIFIRKPRTMLWQSGTLLAGSLVPLVFRLGNLVGDVHTEFFDYSLIGYSMAIIGLAYGIYRSSLVETIPVTSDLVLDGMEDGLMVLDLHNNIIDVNPAAEKIVGLSRHHLYGKSIRSVLPDWFDLSQATEEGREVEMRRSVKSEESWRYLDVRLSSLKDQMGNSFGQLIIWRDITERKITENARQRARNEMFVLLNAISNAASHANNQEDFLSDAIYQIIYPFKSDGMGIFLVDENVKNGDVPRFRLVAHFGLSVKATKSMGTFSVEGNLLEEPFKSRLPIAIARLAKEHALPAVLQQDEITSLVILPLFIMAGNENPVLGAMCLFRREYNPYTPDQITRLTAIAEQIATLIDNDRRRQLMIVLAERERLMRDLHDSVSQKLYGLVTLTEAAQAGLEAGSKVIPSQVLSKIGENARQAVKEMRLFLYEMQPVDLEQDGLITVLHHRLAAVEGRADIQARLLAGENLSLTKAREVALYYIAQEALNNVLKHAHAKTVLVTLKQTRRNVILEIVDDGRGFDLKNVDTGGMGLQNMKARTSQINAKLKITSQPGAGTRVQVKVDRT